MITRESRIREVHAHPLGRDIIDKILLQLGRSRRWVTNPAVGSIRLAWLPRLTRGHVDEGFIDTLVTLLNQHPDVPLEDDEPLTRAWWKEAVFYQIYPRSFADSNGDGIGDLPGIIDRLDHLVDLGVDAVWLCPIYDSPNDDNGYDIRDYHSILAEFGTMADFDRLLTELHERGMRLIMDLVVNHTSDEHPWFREALADPGSPYRPFYFLRPGSGEDGSEPPNNWTSFFSGPAWRPIPNEHDMWALHLFSAKQMDLDWEHAPMRAAVVDMVKWWLDKGVDGFRLDVINYISKAPGLPDGDPMIGELMEFTGVEHYFAGPRLHDHLRQLRQEAFEPYAAVAIGETPGVGIELGKLLAGDNRNELDLIFNFDHLEAPGRVRFDDYRYDLRHLRRHLERHQSAHGNRHWMSLFFDNHDNPRMVSKVDPRPEHRARVAKLLATIQLTLRGTPFLYQGQEIGMVNQSFTSIDQLRDVESLNRYAELRDAGADEQPALADVLAGTRDHARTPMAWTAEPHGGFTTGEPWIEGDGDHVHCNVADAMADQHSVLNWHRSLIALRRANPALVYGDVSFDARPRGHLWSYRRRLDDREFLVLLNLGDRRRRVRPVEATYDLVLASEPGSTTRANELAPYEARVFSRSSRGAG